MAKEQGIKSPPVGETTKSQQQSGIASFMVGSNLINVLSGTYTTYRRMRSNPTVALARMVATAPIRTSSWSIEASDRADNTMVEFIQDHINRLWPELIKNVLLALDYGFSPFEKVWELRDGRLSLRKLKPLLVDKTKLLINKDDGGFEGFQQDGIRVAPEKCFLFTNDGEAGDLYGRSRHENIREHAWTPWIETAAKQMKYITKVAGVIPMIEYPEGTSLDANGREMSNFDIAKLVLASLGKGDGVAMPNTFAKYAGDLAKSGVDLSQLKAWSISFLETKGAHGQDLTNTLRHYESLIMRGWLVPERAATEGQFGTKADAGEHADIALTAADLLLDDILRSINQYLVNPLLIYNWGQDAADAVYLEKGGLSPELKSFYRAIVKEVLVNPANVDLFLGMLDVDALLDNVELPKSAEIVDQADIERTALPNKEQVVDGLSRAITQVYRGLNRG